MADPSGFNNPQLGRGFGNIASAFAPPAAQDIYAYARAAEARQKAERAADLWRQAQDPNFDQQRFDRSWVASGGAPASSYYAVDKGDATKRYGIGVESVDRRRGQDLDDSAKRYGIDRGSADHRYKTDEDNKTSVANTKTKEEGDTTRALIAPIAPDHIQHLPPSVASQFNVPQTRGGIVKLAPGQKAVTPGGTELQGNAKPLTLEEIKAKTFEGMDPKQQQAITFGATPVETVIDPATGKPKTMTRPDMVATGTPEAQKPGTVYNWRGGTATMGPDGKLVDTQTGQVLPPGEGVQAPSGVQSKDPLGATTANQTAANSKAAGLQVMGQALGAYKKLLQDNPGIVGIPGNVRGAAQNIVSVAQEFGAAFGNLAPDARVTADQVAQFAGQISQGRDPAIAQLRVAQADLAYKWAQMQNPSGEVSRQAYERALEALSGGTLANNQSALEAVTAIEQALAREMQGVQALRNPQGGASQPAAPAPNRVQYSDGKGGFINWVWNGTAWVQEK